MQYLEEMKAILPLVLLFLSTTMLAQNIPSIEQVEAELEELKKKDDLRAYTLELARQRDSLIEVFDRQVLNLEQELSSTEASLSQIEFDFDNAMTSIEALNQNKTMLENKNSQQAIEISELHAQIIELQTTISSLESNLAFSNIDTLLPVNQHPDVKLMLMMLGISDDLKGRDGAQYYPYKSWDEESSDEHKWPICYVWRGLPPTNDSQLKRLIWHPSYTSVLIVNVSNQLIFLPLESCKEPMDENGWYFEVFSHFDWRANLSWRETRGIICCQEIGCKDCSNYPLSTGHIELFKNDKLIYKRDVTECTLATGCSLD